MAFEGRRFIVVEDMLGGTMNVNLADHPRDVAKLNCLSLRVVGMVEDKVVALVLSIEGTGVADLHKIRSEVDPERGVFLDPDR